MSYYTSVIILVLLALVVLSVLILENNRIPENKKKLFLVTNILIGLAAIFECAGIHISGNGKVPSWVLSVVKAFDYTLTPLAGGALILLMTKTKNKKIIYGVGSLFVINAIFQFVSIFTGWMIKIKENNIYTHEGTLYPLYMGFYSLVLIFLVVVLILYGKSFKKQNRVSLYATIGLILIGIIMQELFGDGEFRVAYIALAFGSAYFFIHYTEFAQQDMDEQLSQQRIRILRDALTGVYSRFAYIDDMSEYDKSKPENFVVFLMDVDSLKAANDSHGHEAGDEMLCGAADCISSTIGRDNKVYRIGGDEFVVFASMAKEEVYRRINELKTEMNKWSGAKITNLSISIGYALANDHPNFTVEELAIEADKMMYEQKVIYYQQSNKN